MQEPSWTAGPRLPSPWRTGGALALSVLAHAVALAVWVQVTQASSGPIRMSRKHGGMTVQVVSLARPRRASPAAPDTPSASQEAAPITAGPTKQPPRRPSGLATATTTVDAAMRTGTRAEKPGSLTPSEPPSGQSSRSSQAAPTADSPAIVAEAPASVAATTPSASASQAEPAALPPPSPTPPSASPGARFASLFAPVVSQPIGHGKWRSNTPSFRPPQDALAAMQREQAIAGIRQAVQRQTEHWQALLQAQALAGRCDIRLSLERQGMQLRCTSDEDFARLAGSLQGVLNLHADLAPQSSDSCLVAQDRGLAWMGCEAQARPASDLAASTAHP